MPEILYALAVLACPVGMGLMMYFMMRRNTQSRPAQPPATGGDELARLRAEIDQLQAQQRAAAPPTAQR